MNGLLLLIISVIVLSLAYLLYGRFLARKWGIDPSRKTPAVELEDGKEYVPTSPMVLFGHEFASIAGAGPINGPIIAAMFGWFPVLLWLLLGSVFYHGDSRVDCPYRLHLSMPALYKHGKIKYLGGGFFRHGFNFSQ